MSLKFLLYQDIHKLEKKVAKLEKEVARLLRKYEGHDCVGLNCGQRAFGKRTYCCYECWIREGKWDNTASHVCNDSDCLDHL